MYHYGVTLLGVFLCGFADSEDVLVPHQRTLSQPIVFGLSVPYVTPQIMCACEHLKSMTCSEHFSSLDIIRAYDQYALGRFGVIPPSQALACKQIKIGLKTRKRNLISGIVSIPGLCDVRYLPFEILDKWKYAGTVRNHCKRIPLRHALSTM